MAREVKGRNGGTLKPQEKGDKPLNPRGNHTGTLHSKTIIRKWLAVINKEENPISGEIESLTQLDFITLQQVLKARNGERASFAELLDRMEGKATNNVDVKSDGEKLTTTIFQLDARFKSD